jgi:Protein of unknown function (DUF3052)
MAESSATPLPRKLGIKPGQRLAFVQPPTAFLRPVGPLPAGAYWVADWQQEDGLDLIVFFASDQADMARHLPDLARRLSASGGLWVAWPKKVSGVATDLSDDVVRAAGLALGLVDNKVCSVDPTWSAQRFVYRLADRPRRRTAMPDSGSRT